MDEQVNGEWSLIMPRIVSVWFPRWPILRFLADKTRNSAPTQADAALAQQ